MSKLRCIICNELKKREVLSPDQNDDPICDSCCEEWEAKVSSTYEGGE